MTGARRLTYQQLLDEISSAGHPYQVLGKTTLGKELVCVEMGRRKEPPIVITAGSHATEWAGPLAALRLVSSLESEHKIYLLPCRDPLGMEGFAACMRQEIGVRISLQRVGDPLSLIEKHGKVVHNEGGVILATIGQFGALVVDESKIRRFFVEQHLLPEMISTRPELIEKLAGKYLFFLESWGDGKCWGWDGDPFDHPAKVMYVSENGAVGNLNRFFNRDDAPIEVTCFRDLLDRVKPGLILDLHEGFGSKFYLIVPSSDDPLQDRIARAMTKSIRDRGFELSTFDELAPFWGPRLTAGFHDLGDGIYSGEHMIGAMSLGGYGRRYGPTVTTEAGMEAPVEQRINLIEWSVMAAINTYEAHYR